MENLLKSYGLVPNTEKLKGIIEAVLFAIGDDVIVKDMCELLYIDENQLDDLIDQMNIEYKNEKHGFFIIQFNNKLQMTTKPEYSQYIKKIVKVDSRQNLSQAALETLSVIAYRQPITKIQIDELRGVRSDRAIATLVEKGLIIETGRLETPGRPILYGTTDSFLKYFGFKNINELPELIEFKMDNMEK